MDEIILRKLAATVSALVPDAGLDAKGLKSLIDKYGSTALSPGAPNHGIAALCEAALLIRRLERGGETRK